MQLFIKKCQRKILLRCCALRLRLEDECQLAAFRVESTLSVELRLLGGEEEEENWPCQSTNGRFVNVVAGFGHKKGPNVRS
ncbi:unnamed protein product [Candidula unifasciata]|uniref:Uncharacterized protein n=1 Tax=Candidula unifasciata TaxID=100452 RepID=A0A8S3ZLQ8_9EUPU|nr:unnamed protein product [Candidula unifasciata]